MAASTARECGTCSLCCKNVTIAELGKSYGRWCTHCAVGKGCTIYEARPETCRRFACFWLQVAKLPDELRPDRCGVILCPGPHPLYGRVIRALVEPGSFDRVHKPRLKAVLGTAQRDGYKVFVSDGRTTRQLLPDGTLVETTAF